MLSTFALGAVKGGAGAYSRQLEKQDDWEYEQLKSNLLLQREKDLAGHQSTLRREEGVLAGDRDIALARAKGEIISEQQKAGFEHAEEMQGYGVEGRKEVLEYGEKLKKTAVTEAEQKLIKDNLKKLDALAKVKQFDSKQKEMAKDLIEAGFDIGTLIDTPGKTVSSSDYKNIAETVAAMYPDADPEQLVTTANEFISKLSPGKPGLLSQAEAVETFKQLKAEQERLNAYVTEAKGIVLGAGDWSAQKQSIIDLYKDDPKGAEAVIASIEKTDKQKARSMKTAIRNIGSRAAQTTAAEKSKSILETY
jgi:hypothetical protein